MKSPRKPLYKIADKKMTAYVRKPSCLNKSGQQVTVKIDTENEMKSYPEQFLIASSAEFTKNHSNERRTRGIWCMPK
jgi:hypothetical protein